MTRQPTDHQAPASNVHELIRDRRSPSGFLDTPVSDEALRALFEAARWAASSYNEQPWRYLVARKQDARAYERILSILVEGNRAWARHAPVLALGLVSTRFVRNDKPNVAAHHDLGAASAQLTFEATRRGLVVHQMIGIEPEKARALYDLPEGIEAVTGLAIGRASAPEATPEAFRERDLAPRQRRAMDETEIGRAHV